MLAYRKNISGDTSQKSDFENLKRCLAQTYGFVLMPEK
jgi:hypothetical protein